MYVCYFNRGFFNRQINQSQKSSYFTSKILILIEYYIRIKKFSFRKTFYQVSQNFYHPSNRIFKFSSISRLIDCTDNLNRRLNCPMLFIEISSSKFVRSEIFSGRFIPSFERKIFSRDSTGLKDTSSLSRRRRRPEQFRNFSTSSTR